jgi:lambda family phage portal protein
MLKFLMRWLGLNRPLAITDAAKTTSENRRHWANADGLSPAASYAPWVRDTVRKRARYEAESNCYASGIAETLARDLVGTGPRLQILTENQSLNREIESAFRAWAYAVGMAEKLRLAARAKVVDGEAVILLDNDPTLPEVQLVLRVFESDLLTTPWGLGTDPNLHDGIRFDSAGNPLEYYLLTSHPGDGGGEKWKRIPAERLLHWFRPIRPGQTRGISELAAALPLFAQLRRYTLATLAAAEVAADFALLLHSDGPGDEQDPPVPFEELEIAPRMLTTLPKGWSASQVQPTHPTTEYAGFKGELLAEIARCLSMPFNVAAGMSRDYNYSSGRLDFQNYFKMLEAERSALEVHLDRIFRAWFEEAKAVYGWGGIPENFHWFFDGWPHVDPVKEAQADEIRLLNHTTTLAAIYAERGQDWEDNLRQRAKEVLLMGDLGLSGGPPPASQQNQGPPRNFFSLTGEN